MAKKKTQQEKNKALIESETIDEVINLIEDLTKAKTIIRVDTVIDELKKASQLRLEASKG